MNIVEPEEDAPYDPRPDAPEQATHFGHCSYYKIGRNDWVFIYVDGDWIRSSKTGLWNVPGMEKL